MTPASDPARYQWVKVEFYGAAPIGQTVVDVDLTEIAGTLSRVFGFEYIDGLVVQRAAPESGTVTS